MYNNPDIEYLHPMQLFSDSTPPDPFFFEKKLRDEGYRAVMGLDEVGRGCLAGPVVAAGVILDPDVPLPGVTDSKMVKTHEQRKKLAGLIKEKALCWKIESCTPAEIDRHNILKASLLGMRKCVENAAVPPDYLLIDGNRYLPEILPHTCLVKGDSRSVSIGAASLLAKVWRDEYMYEQHQLWPWYGWDTNVGYPTSKHYAGLAEYGACPLHRRSFKLRTTREISNNEGFQG